MGPAARARRPGPALALAVVLALVLGACSDGGDDEAATTTSSSTSSTSTTSITTTSLADSQAGPAPEITPPPQDDLQADLERLEEVLASDDFCEVYLAINDAFAVNTVMIGAGTTEQVERAIPVLERVFRHLVTVSPAEIQGAVERLAERQERFFDEVAAVGYDMLDPAVSVQLSQPPLEIREGYDALYGVGAITCPPPAAAGIE